METASSLNKMPVEKNSFNQCWSVLILVESEKLLKKKSPTEIWIPYLYNGKWLSYTHATHPSPD